MKVAVRWLVIISTSVVVIAFLLGTAGAIAQVLLPEESRNGLLPVLSALAVTLILTNGLIGLMQFFGKSPLDLLPERTPRQLDPKRFGLTRSKDIETLKIQAETAMKQKEYNWAFEFADAWRKLRPGEIAPYEILGKIALENSNIEKAMELGQKILELDVSEYDGYSILARASLMSGQLAAARDWFTKSLSYVSPELLTQPLDRLADVHQRMGDFEIAKNRYEEAQRLDQPGFTFNYRQQKIDALTSILKNSH